MAVGPGKPLSARRACVRLGAGIVFHRTDWKIKTSSKLSETPSFEFGGFNHRTANLSDAQITFGGWWDARNNPCDDPFGLQDGDEIATVKLHLAGPTSPFWLIPLAIIESIENTANVNDNHKFDVVMWQQGSAESAGFFYPTGEVIPL
jgi:hypothetical protein